MALLSVGKMRPTFSSSTRPLTRSTSNSKHLISSTTVYQPHMPVLPRHVARAWQQVTDKASGKLYYWNTATNETAWELPAAEANTTTSSSSSSTTTTVVVDPSNSSSAAAAAAAEAEAGQPQQESMSFDTLFQVLSEAYNADGSGMQFWETAPAHRLHGCFDPPFFDYLEQQQKLEGADAEHKDGAFKMMCRLSNPLLRQPAPFEF